MPAICMRTMSLGFCLVLLLGLALPIATEAAGGTAGATPLPPVALHVGPPPENCLTADLRLIHRGRGTTPFIWVGGGALRGNSSWYVENHRLVLGFGNRERYGYPQKIFWQLINGAQGPVTLRGWNIRTGQRIWFGHPVLPDPDHHRIAWPAAIVRLHRAPTLTFFPATGCYTLQARWRGGGWTVSFAAGFLTT